MFKNTMKTTVMVGGLGGLIVLVGGLLGGLRGLMIGLGLALAVVGSSYWFSDKLAIRAAGAQYIERSESPQFYDLVASIAERAGMAMPRAAISPSQKPKRLRHGAQPAPRRRLCHPEPPAFDAL